MTMNDRPSHVKTPAPEAADGRGTGRPGGWPTDLCRHDAGAALDHTCLALVPWLWCLLAVRAAQMARLSPPTPSARRRPPASASQRPGRRHPWRRRPPVPLSAEPRSVPCQTEATPTPATRGALLRRTLVRRRPPPPARSLRPPGFEAPQQQGWWWAGQTRAASKGRSDAAATHRRPGQGPCWWRVGAGQQARGRSTPARPLTSGPATACGAYGGLVFAVPDGAAVAAVHASRCTTRWGPAWHRMPHRPPPSSCAR